MRSHGSQRQRERKRRPRLLNPKLWIAEQVLFAVFPRLCDFHELGSLNDGESAVWSENVPGSAVTADAS
jgi:hypothetical protein